MHTRGHVELGSEHVTVHVGVLAELISFNATKGGAAGMHCEPEVLLSQHLCPSSAQKPGPVSV